MPTDPLPLPSAESRPFWTSGGRGALEICRCGACGRWMHPPQPYCAPCGSFDVTPQPVSGLGRVWSFTVNEQPWVPGQAVPFVLAVVEPDEQPGLWVITRLAACAPHDVAIGLRVRVRFEPAGDLWLPLFEPWSGHG